MKKCISYKDYKNKCEAIYPDYHDACPSCGGNMYQTHERTYKAKVKEELKTQGLLMVEPSEIKIGEV